MILRKSTEKDLKNIMKIINEAKAFLKNNKVDQWQNGYPNEEVILKDIRNNISYVLEDTGEIIGTTSLSFDVEETYNNIYEGKWISNGKYAVIHRIAVSNNINRKGIGTEIIKKSEEICLSKGIKNIKIDTHEDNLIMQKLLEKNSFKYCGVIYLLDGSKRIAFEKEF
ncbi:MAG: GNAT family N-acetyltransferase [Clostridium sp.]|mgnify:FL=1|uniref:GNAT family N-acetyltransferase n=1 Tax=Clostridium sp. TaxID=1506 RepID=UPI002907F190|nr:GNAT family N-acetyltransferase [Clostridium sp.]MDU7148958.1 GNAT family N-acetyltransferase [Clostridium sp.]MDU7242447.1 GNAT family N-acetyltransferase [Clostridium sp.]